MVARRDGWGARCVEIAASLRSSQRHPERIGPICHCEPTGRRDAPPEDRLREAIWIGDCFVSIHKIA
jgi:hypothetical protein